MVFTIEIAVTDFLSAAAAVAGGADRIELCTALSEGGLTPAAGLIQQCRQSFSLPIFPILRPRAGDFLYTEEEFGIIKKDAQLCKQLGCDGVVVGFLQKDGSIDEGRTAAIVKAVYPLEVTFHRAFDRCKDPLKSAATIINAGCQRLLTSGQRATAPEGQDLIRELVTACEDQLIILPGSGINPTNIKALQAYTGATEFHGSLRSRLRSNMDFIHPQFADAEDSYYHGGLLPEAVQALRQALTSN